MNDNKNIFLARYGDSDHINHLIDHPDYDVQENILKNPTITPHHLSKLLNSDYTRIKAGVANHENITPDHISKILGDDSYNSHVSKNTVMANPKITTLDIKKSFDQGSPETKRFIGMHSLTPRELRKHILNNTDNEDVKRIINSREKHDQKLDDLLDIYHDELLKTK